MNAVLSAVSAPAGTSVGSHSRGLRRPWRVLLIAAMVAAGLAGGMGGTASADTTSDTTVAHAQIAGAILLTGLTTTFTLVGLPGATVAENGAVSLVVTTNNIGGYAVTVQAATATMLPTTAGNVDSIPIGNLKVRETAAGNAGAFTSLSSGSPVTVHTQLGRSVILGDAVSNDYQVLMPFIATDTYNATLNYIATTL